MRSAMVRIVIFLATRIFLSSSPSGCSTRPFPHQLQRVETWGNSSHVSFRTDFCFLMSTIYRSLPTCVKLDLVALPRLPSIEDLQSNPSLLEHLPIPQLRQVFERLRVATQSLGGADHVPANPVALAISHPKFSWMDSPHIRYLGERISSCVRASKVGGQSRALLITMPPRHAKSHVASIWTPFWFLANYPEDHVILVAAEADNAAKWGERVRRLVELYGQEYGLVLNPKKVARNDWELTTGGGMKCFGVGGTISGNPAKLFVIDDAIKNDEQARSDYQRETMWEWWDSTAQQRIEPDTTTLVIGTRYHEDDLLGRMLKHSDLGDGLKFETVNFPAKAEAGDLLHRPLGEGLWINHQMPGGNTWGQDYYDRLERTRSPYVWNSVYQQRPSAPGGNLVDHSWWRFYRPSELPATFDQACQSWDLSLDAQKKTDSRHAGLVLYRVGALIYIRDGFREHCDINKVVTTIRAWSHLFPQARQKLIERATAGVALQQTLRREVAGVIAWPPKGRQKGSKEAELDATIPAIRSGNILLPCNPDGTRPVWVQAFIEELRQFPRGQYDDWVDSFSQGVNYLFPATTAALDRDHMEAGHHIDPKDSQQQHIDAIHARIRQLAEPKLKAMREFQNREQKQMIPFARGFDTGFVRRRGGSGMW